MIPAWLHILSIAFLALGALCAAIVGIDLARHPQRMWIMNAVWPTVALFGTVAALYFYFRYGRPGAKRPSGAAARQDPPRRPETPFSVMVAKGAAHCGAGCTLGDIVAEWLAFAFPLVATWFGWRTLFSEKIFAVWVLDYLLAFAFGIAFQYFTIAPMRGLGLGKGLVAAVKADAASLTAWQLGMYGFMALAYFGIFRAGLDTELKVVMPEFWFMMQIAMLAGFATSYPVNWWLLRRGVKERM